MTQKALEKINGKHIEILTKYAAELRRHLSGGDRWHALEAERLGGKIRGYLEALEACEILTHREVQALYLYFKIS